jgi:hypothetical protein
VGISLPTAIIVIRKSLTVKCFCITFILAGLFYQIESLPAYRATAQENQPAKAQPSAPAIEQPLTNQQATSRSGDAKPSPDKIKKAEWVQIGINTFIALFIFWQAWTYHQQRRLMQRQLTAMKRQLKVMRDTLNETKRIFDLTERPIVVVYNATILDFAPDRPLSATILLSNKGRTAAKNVSVFFRIAKPGYLYGVYPEGEEYPFELPFLGAGDTESVTDAPANAITINGEMFKSIIDGREGLLVYGRGSYKDMAGRDFILDEFAFSYRPTAKGLTPDHYYPTMWKKNKASRDAAADEDKKENPN